MQHRLIVIGVVIAVASAAGIVTVIATSGTDDEPSTGREERSTADVEERANAFVEDPRNQAAYVEGTLMSTTLPGVAEVAGQEVISARCKIGPPTFFFCTVETFQAPTDRRFLQFLARFNPAVDDADVDVAPATESAFEACELDIEVCEALVSQR